MAPNTRSSARKNKSSTPAPTSAPAQTPEETLIALATRLLHLVTHGTLPQVKRLFEMGAPGWYQEETMGWSCLHFAVERGEPDIVEYCLANGAVWNSADLLGRTAGDMALSLNDERSYMLIRNQGIRQEMIHHAIQTSQAKEQNQRPTSETPVETETGTETESERIDVDVDAATGQVVLTNMDPTSAGNNHTFLKSNLTWEKGDDGKERVVDEDGNGVMMGWEEPLMRAHTKYLKEKIASKVENGEPISVLNIGFGLGIIDTLLQEHIHPTNHSIIEAHPSVLSHIEKTSFHNKEGINILPGRWQDWCHPDKVGQLLEKSHSGAGYDFIFIDTFAEDYEELKAFFEVVPDLLEGPDSVFSFWNGLGATNPLIYDVACNLAEMHMDDVGLMTEWHDVLVDESVAEETWKGIKRKYWTLPVYKLPVASYSM